MLNDSFIVLIVKLVGNNFKKVPPDRNLNFLVKKFREKIKNSLNSEFLKDNLLFGHIFFKGKFVIKLESYSNLFEISS